MSYTQGNNGSFAQSEIREAWLSTDFGESYARRTFGNELVDTLPRYVRGKRKGQLKGKMIWRKVIKGGWISGVGLVPPGKTYAHGIWNVPFGEEPVLLHGYDATDRDEVKAALNHDKATIIEPAQETTPSNEEKQRLLDTIAFFREQGNIIAAEMLEKAIK